MNMNRYCYLILVGGLGLLLSACGSVQPHNSLAPPQNSAAFTAGTNPPTSMKAGGTITLAATDTSGADISWSVSCKSSQCGTFTPSVTADAASTSFRAPTVVPAGGTVTIAATPVTGNSTSASATINIGEAATSLSDGTYVFHLSGVDSNVINGISNYYVAGAFTIAGGSITGGEQDFVDYYDSATDTFDPASSSIQSTADGNLQIVLSTVGPDWSVGVNGVETINASVVSSSSALISEFDSFGSSTGTLDRQAGSPATPSLGYAFFVSGLDQAAIPLGLGGVINVDGSGTISGNGSVLDINDGGVITQNQTFEPSTVTVPDAFGRVQFNLVPSANAGIPSLTLTGYVVDGTTIQVVEGMDDFMGDIGGTLLGQSSNTGNFGNGSVAGATYVVSAEGVDTNGPLQLAGALTFNASGGSMAGNITFNDLAGQVVTTNVTSGTYSVDATGRVTITGLTAGALGPASLRLYLDGNGNALTVSMDSSEVTAGSSFQQTVGASLTASSYSISADGTSPPTESTQPWAPLSDSNVPWSAVGIISADGSGNLTGFTDIGTLGGPQTTDVTLSGTASGSNQVLSGTITGLDAASETNQDGFAYYVVDGTRCVAIETDTAQLGLGFLELQQ
ncbi:MAG TPA: hypothetical protein VL983_01280 [Terriglobales bacterium]|nr:hypothetical protein [Terriglobales bacterium]